MTPSAFQQFSRTRGVSREAPELGKPASMEGPEPKASQAEANYGNAEQKCSTCEHFDGTGACSKVEGEIDPNGHSRFYSRNAVDEMPEFGRDSESDTEEQ